MNAPLKLRTLAMVPLQVTRDTLSTLREAQLFMVASSLAYTTLLSVIPLIAVSFSIFSAFGGMQRLYSTVEPFVLNNLTEGTSDEVIQLLQHFIGNIHGGAIGLWGTIGLIFTCMSMLLSAEKGINRIWKAPLNRSLFNRIAPHCLAMLLQDLLG